MRRPRQRDGFPLSRKSFRASLIPLDPLVSASLSLVLLWLIFAWLCACGRRRLSSSCGLRRGNPRRTEIKRVSGLPLCLRPLSIEPAVGKHSLPSHSALRGRGKSHPNAPFAVVLRRLARVLRRVCHIAPSSFYKDPFCHLNRIANS